MPSYLPNSKNTDSNGVLAPEVYRLTQHDSHTRDFLDFLAPGEIVTFQTFDDGLDKRPGLASVFHGTLKQHAGTLAHLNNLGAGVFMMVNQGDGEGRAKENVIRIRSVFADFDGVALPERFELEPHLLVESSPGKHHVYWLVSDLPLKEFKPAQKALASHFGSDGIVSDLCRVMRVPGFFHCKYEPVMVRLLETGSHPAYSRAELLAAWPTIEEALTPKPEPETESGYTMPKGVADADKARRYALAALQQEHDNVAGAKEGERNRALNSAAFSLGQLVAAGALERQEVEDALTGAAKACGLPDGESLPTVRSGLEAGLKQPREIPEPRTKQRAKTFGGFVGSSPEDTENFAEDEEPWQDMKDLPDLYPLVPILPAEMLPEPLRLWLLDISERTCLPLEFVACPALVALGAVVGRSVGIHPKCHDDWLVVPNLWGGIVGRPGLMKSAAIAEATKPLARLAAEAQKTHEQAKFKAEAKSERLKLEIATLKEDAKRSAKKGGKDRDLNQI